MIRLLIITVILCLIAPISNAENYEMAVMVEDKNPKSRGSVKSVAGGIAAIREQPCTWTDAEQLRYLILIVENMTPANAMALSDPWWLDDDLTVSPGVSAAEMIHNSRKFKINFQQLASKIYKDFDDALAQDQTIRYQPFLDGGLSIDDSAPNQKNIIVNMKP